MCRKRAAFDVDCQDMLNGVSENFSHSATKLMVNDACLSAVCQGIIIEEMLGRKENLFTFKNLIIFKELI